MRIVAQRVTRAEVRSGGDTVARIGRGLLLLIAVEKTDTPAVLDWCADKVLHMRVFEDSAHKMNVSVLDTGGEMLAVSQFTLAADLSRGRRPGFERAAPPAEAEPLFEAFVARLRSGACRVATGRFRSMMEVELVNDGPVTIVIERGGS
ncbi:MAG: D-aminoacyl-tRNA deacylase [Candidatus Polarisedimenticolia bacterium]